MARTCVFCGSDGPLSREHVLPGWHGRGAGVSEPVAHIRARVERGKGYRREEKDLLPFRQTARVVCPTCNNGWMSRLEDDAARLLSEMIAGRDRVLDSGGQATLASWAAKTALMLDRGQAAEDRVVFAEHYREVGATHAPPMGAQVVIAAYDQTLHMHVQTNAFELTVAGKYDPPDRNVYVVTFTIGPVAFRLIGTREPELHGYFWPQPRLAHRIWPAEGSVTWTSQPALDDVGVDQFATMPHRYAASVSDEVVP